MLEEEEVVVCNDRDEPKKKVAEGPPLPLSD